MGLTVNVRDHTGMPVVKLAGAGCSDLLTRVADGIGAVADGGPVVIDMSEVTLNHPECIHEFVRALCEATTDVRLVTSRLTARRVVRWCRPPSSAAVFASVDEALGTPTALPG
jgi:hypothetical protein